MGNTAFKGKLSQEAARQELVSYHAYKVGLSMIYRFFCVELPSSQLPGPHGHGSFILG